MAYCPATMSAHALRPSLITFLSDDKLLSFSCPARWTRTRLIHILACCQGVSPYLPLMSTGTGGIVSI